MNPVRILLLEDSEIDAELITRQLNKMGTGFAVERAVIRREYERIIAASKFDLVLSDYSLPGFTGVEALQIARALDPNVPFIFVSGVLGEDFATEALRAGATDYVTKKNLTRLPMVLKRALVEASERGERQRAVQALRESERRFRAMADTAPALIWEVDTSGKVTFANDRFLSELGISADRMVNVGWKGLVFHDDWPWFKAMRNSTFANREAFAGDVRVVNERGEPRWLRLESRPRFSEAGEFLGYVGCGVDVTVARLARDSLETQIEERTAELRVKEEALRQSQKMEAIGQLTGGIAHDFNNMLSAIIGSGDMLRKRLADNQFGDCGRYVDLMVSSANRAAALTQRLLAFSRQQTLDVKPTLIDARVQSLADLLRRTIGPSIELGIDVPTQLWPADTDPNQFESAIVNLVINSRDAMPNGGRLTITGQNLSLNDDEEIPGIKHGDYVRIAISDTGSGMDEATLTKAIDPFFTTKPIGHGTGLGLSMVYGFMSQTGGTLDITSELGKGTTASLYMPRSRGVAVDDVVEEKPAEDNSIQSGTVLVVEDEPAVRMLVVEYLANLGYDMLEAPDSETALTQLRSDRHIDLLVTDVGLPGMGGRELAVHARNLKPDLAIIFATGYADGAGSRSDLVGDNMDLILKPFTIDSLAQRVKALMASRTQPYR